MTSKNIKEVKRGITHAGKFHADEVFTTALLKILNPDIEITRSNKVMGGENPDSDIIVYDIGGGKFDHHQPDAEVRGNGVKYAAFGLVWREYAYQLGISQIQIDKFDRQFIQPMDITDNTGIQNPLSMVMISLFMPFSESELNQEDVVKDSFFEAVGFARKALERQIELMKYADICNNYLRDIYDRANDKSIIVLDKYMPFGDVFIESDVKFVIYPSLRGGYSTQAVKQHSDGAELKIPFPSNWRGLTEYAHGSNKVLLDGVTFCHTSGFMISTVDINSAINACRIAMQLDRL